MTFKDCLVAYDWVSKSEFFTRYIRLSGSVPNDFEGGLFLALNQRMPEKGLPLNELVISIKDFYQSQYNFEVKRDPHCDYKKNFDNVFKRIEKLMRSQGQSEPDPNLVYEATNDAIAQTALIELLFFRQGKVRWIFASV